MSKNRRNQSAAVRFGPLVKVCLICAFIGGSGVGYVWQKNQIFELGKQIKQCELKLEELRRQNKQKTDTLAFLRSPKVLDARMREFKLNLVLPHPQQILRLYEWTPTSVIAAEPNMQPARTGGPALSRVDQY